MGGRGVGSSNPYLGKSAGDFPNNVNSFFIYQQGEHGDTKADVPQQFHGASKGNSKF